MRAAATAVTPAVLTMRSALGIASDHGPKGSNWQALAYPKFRWYFAGSVTSNFGTWLQNTAQMVLAYQWTHSVFWVGMVTCAQFSSPLVLGPWAGVLTHRFGTWRTLVATQCASMLIAITLAALQFTHSLTIPRLFAAAGAIGLAFTFALPAQSLTVAALVPKAETKRALAMDSVSYNLARALGPVLSLVVFTTIGFGWVFALNAGSFLFFTAVLLRLRPHNVYPEVNRSRVMNGLRIAWRDRRIMILLLMVAAVTVAADPILVLGPGLARSFGASADWGGIFIAALGAGNVIGSLRPTSQAPSTRRAAAVLCILSLSMMIFVTAHWIWLSVAAAFVAGMACLVAGAATRALLLHHSAGPAQQAAVMAAWAVAWAGSKPIASLADGSLAGLIGIRLTGFLLALPALVPALALTTNRRSRIRHDTSEGPAPATTSAIAAKTQIPITSPRSDLQLYDRYVLSQGLVLTGPADQ
jgi:predicted MFS family arabinose efflux permease